MNTTNPKWFQDLLKEAGWTPQSYSGRGMFGKKCLAVTLDVEPSKMIADLLRYLPVSEDTDTMEDTLDGLAKILDKTCQDSMGLGTVLYWPNIPYMEDEDDNDE